MSYNKSATRLLGIPVEQTEDHKANINIISLNRSEKFRQVVDGALKGSHCEQMLDVGNRHYQIIANPVAESGKEAVRWSSSSMSPSSRGREDFAGIYRQRLTRAENSALPH